MGRMELVRGQHKNVERHDWPFSIYQKKGVRKEKGITTTEEKKLQRKTHIKVGKSVPLLT
jgi:hypothetical protein